MEGATWSIWAVDLATVSQTTLFDSGLARAWLDRSPDGKGIVFTRGTGKDLGIEVLEVNFGIVRRVLGGKMTPGEPRWSPDGKKLLFSTHSPPGVSMLNPTDSTAIRMIN